jgi:ectoine hydroxylase-related dioxygenase (phytanoyl-CoA dioxygenase family)
LVLILAVLASGAAYFNFVYGPSKEFTLVKGKWSSLKQCDPSTDSIDDLIVTPRMSTKYGKRVGLEHGAAVVPSILAKDTANELRDYILAMNSESIIEADINSPEHRYRVQPSYKIPIVKKALKEIATHPTVKSMMEQLLGPKPSLTSLDAITATYGAKDQNWHWDADTSHAIYPEEFLAEYAFAIVLQDTTDDMGATAVCPGTHKCSWVKVPPGEEVDDQEVLDEVCPLRMALSQGDGFLYKSDTLHKGRAHRDPNAGDRVVLFIGLTESKQGPLDQRVQPLGDIAGLPWDMWGQTLDDLATIDERPWRPWHTVGLFNGHKDVRPITLIDAFIQPYVDEQEACYVFHEQVGRFFQERMQTWIVTFMIGVVVIALVLYGVLLPCGLMFSYLVSPRLSDPPAVARREVNRANGAGTKDHPHAD